jgi:probable HAF family extracellular repeat protein
VSHCRFASAVLCAAIQAAILPAYAAEMYSIRPLAAAADQINVFAKGINNLGQVVGYTVDRAGNSHATLWDDEGGHPLATLSLQLPFSEAYRINDAGQIAGKATTDEGRTHAVYWDRTGIVDIGTLPGGANSFAMDINAAGVVAGSSEAEIGQSAFTWTRAGGFVDYGNTDPPFRLAVAGFNGLNNNGLLVGTIYVLLSPYHAALGREGQRGVVDISPPGRNSVGMALAINDTGMIVGYQNGESGGPQAAIFHGDGTFDLLGTLGMEESWAEDVNESGVIVGRAFGILEQQLVQKAFVYEEWQMRDLLALAPKDSGWEELFEAAAINDHGVIVGTGVYQGQIRAYVATPIPEPATVALLSSVLGLISLLRMREFVSAFYRDMGCSWR